jgi:radical SAM superfamily enzyme YgiQ (UPF0313 family)
MKVLLLSPKFPETFWSFKHALPFISKKAGEPPLGLLTVAAMLPSHWQKRLIDLNVRALKDSDILWADYVFIGAMSIQEQSARDIIEQCNRLNRKIVAGGPLFTSQYDEFQGVDHFVLNEAELTLPPFLDDLAHSRAKSLYASSEWADMRTTPVPLWELINLHDYAIVNLQYSRGCPFDCEFCDITTLYGRTPRAKSAGQVITEMEQLRQLGWRGHVFFVDDNFIGDKSRLKRELLPILIQWMESNNYPYTLSTEASINMADDAELMQMMFRAGFESVFIGIESPNETSLLECKKTPNRNRNLLDSVHAIQRSGIQVHGGFILGFDHDPPSIFDTLIAFIHDSGIVTAMVGILNVPRGSRLYERLIQEGRVLKTSNGNSTEMRLNFIPRMNPETLLSGYSRVLATIYSPREYYARVLRFLKAYHPLKKRGTGIQIRDLVALSKTIVLLGFIGKERFYYWKVFFWSLFRRPSLFSMAMTHAIYGFHFRKIFAGALRAHST